MLFDLNNIRKEFSRYPFSYDINLSATYKFNNNDLFKFFLFHEQDKVGVEVDDPDYNYHFHGNTSNHLYNFKYSRLINKKLLLQANCAYSNFSRAMKLSLMDLVVEDQLFQSRITAEYNLSSCVKIMGGGVFFRNQTLISGIVPKEELDLNPDGMTDPVETLREALKDLENKVQEAKETSTAFVEEAKKTKEIVTAAEQKISDLETQLQEKQSQIDEQTSKLEELNSEVSKLTADIQQLEAKNQELTAQKENSDKQAIELESKVTNLEQDKTRLASELDRTKKRVQDLENELKRLS